MDTQYQTRAETALPTPDDFPERADEFARRDPTKAILSAFSAGFLLSLLPLGAIAAALVEIAFLLVRPTLLFLGLLKAVDICRNHQNQSVSQP